MLYYRIFIVQKIRKCEIALFEKICIKNIRFKKKIKGFNRIKNYS